MEAVVWELRAGYSPVSLSCAFDFWSTWALPPVRVRQGQTGDRGKLFVL